MTKVVKRQLGSPDKHPPIDKTAIRQFTQRILIWYERYGREFPWRRATSSYERIVAELLLQRTQAATVSRFYATFLRTYPSWEHLSSAKESDLQHLLKPVGLWRQRARMFVQLSRALAELDYKLPCTREDLEQLPGISQYMASAILLLCYGQKEPLLDVNMARILERVYGPRKLADIRYDPFLQEIAHSTVEVADPIKVNWAVMDLAATTCLRNIPRCSECPLANMCRHASSLASSS